MADKNRFESAETQTKIDTLEEQDRIGHTNITGLTTISEVNETRVGKICIVDFYLKPTSTITTSNYVDIVSLTNKAKYTVTQAFPTVVSSSPKVIVMRVYGKKLQWYTGASGGITSSDDVRGQLIFEVG